jgi:hypothetical protein
LRALPWRTQPPVESLDAALVSELLETMAGERGVPPVHAVIVPE